MPTRPTKNETGAPNENVTDQSSNQSETDTLIESTVHVLPHKADASDRAEPERRSPLGHVRKEADSEYPAVYIVPHGMEADDWHAHDSALDMYSESMVLMLTSTAADARHTAAMDQSQEVVNGGEALTHAVEKVDTASPGCIGKRDGEHGVGKEGMRAQAAVDDSGLELTSLEPVEEEEEEEEEVIGMSGEPMDCRASPDPLEGTAGTQLHLDCSTPSKTTGDPGNRSPKDCSTTLKTLEGAKRHLNLDGKIPFRPLDGTVESLSNGWSSPISNIPPSLETHDNNNSPITRPLGWGGGVNGYHPAPTSTAPTPFDSPSPEYDEVISCPGCCLAGLRLPSLCIRTSRSHSAPTYKNLSGDSTANQGLMYQAPPTSKHPPLNAQKNV